MISYTWRSELSPAELTEVDELLAQAAAYDAEAGFSTADPRAAAPGKGRSWHLLITTVPAPRCRAAEPVAAAGAPLAAYLRLDVSGDAGDVQLVVHPDHRSHGITTLLLERLDAEPSGWASIPRLRLLRAWAHGSHPAADRARTRRGAVLSGRVFKTLRPASGSPSAVAPGHRLARQPVAPPLAEVVPGHQRALAPADRATLARASVLLRSGAGTRGLLAGTDADDPAAFPACLALTGGPGLPPPVLTTLLAQGLREVQLAGARVVQLYVDALDAPAVRVAREQGFEHDQSDCRYLLGIQNPPGQGH